MLWLFVLLPCFLPVRAQDLPFRTLYLSSDAAISNVNPPVIQVGTVLTLNELISNRVNYQNGQDFRAGYEFFFNWLNIDNGGIKVKGYTYRLQLVIVDGSDDPDQVRAAVQYMLKTLGIQLFLGADNAAYTEIMAQEVNKTKYAMLVSPSGLQTSIYKGRANVLGVLPPAAGMFKQTFPLVDGLVQNIALLYTNDPANMEACQNVYRLETETMTVVADVPLDSLAYSETDITNAITSFTETPVTPDFVVVCGNYDFCQSYSTIAETMNFPMKMTQFGDCIADLAYWNKDTSAVWMLGSTASSTFFLDNPPPDWGVPTFVSNYTKLWGYPKYQVAVAYTAAQMIAVGIAAAQSFTPSNVVAAIRKVDMNTSMGRVRFDTNGQGTLDWNIVQYFWTAPGYSAKMMSVGMAPPNVPEQSMFFPLIPWDVRQTCSFPVDGMPFYKYGFNLTTGACVECPKGTEATYQVLNQSRFCLPCPKGRSYIVIDPSQTRCVAPCQPGWIPDNTNQTDCIQCQIGYRQLDFSCVLCQPGRYSAVAGADKCQPCPLGTFQSLLGQSGCTPCPIGTSTDSATGLATCRPCKAGTYTPYQGQSECTLCSPGTVTVVTGQTACTNCTPGTYSAWGNAACVPCSVGTFQSNVAQTACSVSPLGTLSPRTQVKVPVTALGWYAVALPDQGLGFKLDTFEACSRQPYLCLANNKCAPGHTGRQCTACLPGYTRTIGSCIPCPSPGMNTIAVLIAVFFNAIFVLFLAYGVNLAMRRPGCMTLQLTKMLVNHSIVIWVCLRFLSRLLPVPAFQAGDQTLLPGLEFIIPILTILTLPSETRFFSATCIFQPTLSAKDAALVASLGNSNHTFYYSQAMAPARQVLVNFQSQAMLSSTVFEVLWPGSVIAAVILVGAGCLQWYMSKHKALWHEAVNFYMHVQKYSMLSAKTNPRYRKIWEPALEAFDCRICGIWHPTDHLSSWLVLRRFYTFDLESRTGLFCRLLQCTVLPLHRHLRSLGYRRFAILSFLRKFLPLASALYYVTSCAVTIALFRAFDCVQLGASGPDSAVFQNEGAVQCGFTSTLVLASIAVSLLWCVVMPLIGFRQIRAVRDKLHTKAVQRDWGVMIFGYERSCWYWELVIFGRKSLVLLLEVLPISHSLRAMCLLLCAVVSCVLQHHWQPHGRHQGTLWNPSLNFLEWYHLTLWVIIAASTLAVATSGSFSALQAVVVLTILLHVAFVFQVLSLILYHLKKSVLLDVDLVKAELLPNSCYKRFLLRLLKAQEAQRQEMPYIAVDALYNWVTFCGARGDLGTPPFILRGPQAAEEFRENHRPLLSQAPDAPAGIEGTKLASKGFRREMQLQILDAMGSVIAGVDARPVFTVAVFDFVVRAAFYFALHTERGTLKDPYQRTAADKRTEKLAQEKRDPLLLKKSLAAYENDMANEKRDEVTSDTVRLRLLGRYVEEELKLNPAFIEIVKSWEQFLTKPEAPQADLEQGVSGGVPPAHRPSFKGSEGVLKSRSSSFLKDGTSPPASPRIRAKEGPSSPLTSPRLKARFPDQGGLSSPPASPRMRAKVPGTAVLVQLDVDPVTEAERLARQLETAREEARRPEWPWLQTGKWGGTESRIFQDNVEESNLGDFFLRISEFGDVSGFGKELRGGSYTLAGTIGKDKKVRLVKSFQSRDSGKSNRRVYTGRVEEEEHFGAFAFCIEGRWTEREEDAPPQEGDNGDFKFSPDEREVRFQPIVAAMFHIDSYKRGLTVEELQLGLTEVACQPRADLAAWLDVFEAQWLKERRECELNLLKMSEDIIDRRNQADKEHQLEALKMAQRLQDPDRHERVRPHKPAEHQVTERGTVWVSIAAYTEEGYEEANEEPEFRPQEQVRLEVLYRWVRIVFKAAGGYTRCKVTRIVPLLKKKAQINKDELEWQDDVEKQAEKALEKLGSAVVKQMNDEGDQVRIEGEVPAPDGEAKELPSPKGTTEPL